MRAGCERSCNGKRRYMTLINVNAVHFTKKQSAGAGRLRQCIQPEHFLHIKIRKEVQERNDTTQKKFSLPGILVMHGTPDCREGKVYFHLSYSVQICKGSSTAKNKIL